MTIIGIDMNIYHYFTCVAMYILILSLRHIPLVHQWSFWGIFGKCYLKGGYLGLPHPD